MAFLKRTFTGHESKTSDGRKHDVARVKGKIGGGGKTRSLETDDSKPISGVFASSTTLLSMATISQSSLSLLDDTSERSHSHFGSWKPSGSRDHGNNPPQKARNSDNTTASEPSIVAQAERLAMISARSRQLPDTWYYSSNHILVNQERARRTIAPLTRMIGLDVIARWHADQMALQEKVHYLDLRKLRLALKELSNRRLGVNVQKGESIRSIHGVMMKTPSNKNNILDRKFTHMGMGTAVGRDGKLFLCQVFRG